MFRKALLIINDHAGQAEKRKQIDEAIGVLADHIPELLIMNTEKQGDAETICRERAEDYDLVVVLGGDGTVHECINGLALLSSPPVIGLLPGGTCNDFSRALSIPQHIRKAAELIKTGTRKKIDIGQMNERYFSNFFGIGLITEASENINQNIKDLFGRISYYISALQTLQGSSSFEFTMVTDQGRVEGQALMVLVANGNFMGTSKLPLPDYALDDGFFDVIVIQESGLSLLKELISVASSDQFKPDPDVVQYFRTPRLTLHCSKPMKADADGETYMETPVELTVMKQRLSFIVGEKED